MKLLINEGLVWSEGFDGNSAEKRQKIEQHVQALQDLARRMSVYGSFEVGQEAAQVRILAQKITLDEVAMNELFSDFLEELFELTLRYVMLGGAGCDFALEVEKAQARTNCLGFA